MVSAAGSSHLQEWASLGCEQKGRFPEETGLLERREPVHHQPRCADPCYFPVPVKLTVWGEFAAPSATFSVAFRAPLVVGDIATRMVQVAPALSVDPQVLSSRKDE